MAPKSQKSIVEPIINRWIVEYYISVAIELFENKQYDDVGALRDVLDSVLARCVESTDLLLLKIKVFDFLCHINDGESPDLKSNQPTTPLESALNLLESMRQECSIPQQEFNNICNLVKDMMVGILIKNNMFDKAKEMLIKHFPKEMFGKKAIFMRLINKKSKMHEVIEQIDFQQFREEIIAFCQRVCTFGVPFLQKAAIHLIDQKSVMRDNEASGSDEQEEAGPSFNQQICTVKFVIRKQAIISKARLVAAYKALAVGPAERTFSQLEEDTEREEEVRMNANLSLRLSPSPERDTNGVSEPDEFFQRDSGSPMEASPADQPPQTAAITPKQAGSSSSTPPVPGHRRLFTVARLVMEPDSQVGSLCASQELDSDVTPEEPTHSQDQETDTHANKTSSRASTSSAESASDIVEGSSGSGLNKKISTIKHHNQSKRAFRRKSPYCLSSEDMETEAPYKTPVKKSQKQPASISPSKKSPYRQSSDDMETEAPHETPVKKSQKRPASISPSNDSDAIRIIDVSLDSSPETFPPPPVPHTSSTPQKDSAQDQQPYTSTWKKLYNTAKESKDDWSDEESYFNTRKKSYNESTLSNSGRRKKWSDRETEKLKEGVQKFGEGNWSKIKSYYKFTDRTNVNLKDRWRTLKRLNQT